MSEMATEALERWLGALAEYFDADLAKGAAGWRFDSTSERGELFLESLQSREEKEALKGRKRSWIEVASEPSTAEQWRDRLRLVEKTAARTLTRAPVGFSAVLPTAAQNPRSIIVRFAFGFSLSFGYRLRRRFTAYFAAGEGKSCVFPGDDGLFALGAVVGPLDLERRELREALPTLSTLAHEAEETYRQDKEVLAEMARLRQCYAEELQCLERLYTLNWGQDAPLLGTPAQGLIGDDAIEAEYVTRLEDLVERYNPRLLFEPLTIGVVEGSSEEPFLAAVSRAERRRAEAADPSRP